MVEVAWAAIGLLAVSLFGSTYYLGSRIDGLSARIDGLSARMDHLSERVDIQGTDLSARIDAQTDRLDRRIDHLSTLVADHIGRHAG